ncbi:MAG: NifB/NifX family molybdenum-iron cluster-binding protein [Deltaproteobacteria bacterium]|jgi:predicted Fe-Mo cluster-binding NifX family protein|nr:NifB/NifX family molybdenum-iron cluster-binding protein [Deltaproteobacteria bacterium]
MKKMIPFLSLVISLTIPVWAYSAEKGPVKIAVASTGKTTAASVSNLAARSPYYLIFDGKGNLTEAVSNPYEDAASGAGPSAANFLAAKGVTIVVAESFGIKMINVLKNKQVRYIEFEGHVDKAVKKALELK